MFIKCKKNNEIDSDKSIFDFQVKDANGVDISMNDYQGKVLLIVNTATGCRYTPQYNALEQLYRKYKKQGFEILDFPCNQFSQQAPGTNEQIVSFCKLNYGITFKIFGKVNVNGRTAAPLFQFLKKKQTGFITSKIKWNFTKFLVDGQGNVVKRFSPDTKPEDMETDIKHLLGMSNT